MKKKLSCYIGKIRKKMIDNAKCKQTIYGMSAYEHCKKCPMLKDVPYLVMEKKLVTDDLLYRYYYGYYGYYGMGPILFKSYY